MFSKLIVDLEKLFKGKSTNVAITDMTKHAADFSKAVDSYVKSLMDPAKRPLLTTISPLIIPPILSLSSVPGTATSSIDALKAATQYATGISLYTAALVVNPAPVMLPLGGIVLPPGNTIVAKLIDMGVLLSIQNDFKLIFLEDPAGVPQEILMAKKAMLMANAIKKAFTTKTNVIISGLDSTLPPPAGIGPQSFSITGPLS
jgi:hypothetical protein